MNGLDIKKIRKKLGFTQVEFAKELEVSARTYHNYEKDSTRIPSEIAEKAKSMIGYTSPINSPTGLGDAIQLIAENLEEAKKIPLFALILKTEYQEGEKNALKQYLEEKLNQTQNGKK